MIFKRFLLTALTLAVLFGTVSPAFAASPTAVGVVAAISTVDDGSTGPQGGFPGATEEVKELDPGLVTNSGSNTIDDGSSGPQGVFTDHYLEEEAKWTQHLPLLRWRNVPTPPVPNQSYMPWDFVDGLQATIVRFLTDMLQNISSVLWQVPRFLSVQATEFAFRDLLLSFADNMFGAVANIIVSDIDVAGATLITWVVILGVAAAVIRFFRPQRKGRVKGLVESLIWIVVPVVALNFLVAHSAEPQEKAVGKDQGLVRYSPAWMARTTSTNIQQWFGVPLVAMSKPQFAEFKANDKYSCGPYVDQLYRNYLHGNSKNDVREGASPHLMIMSRVYEIAYLKPMLNARFGDPKIAEDVGCRWLETSAHWEENPHPALTWIIGDSFFGDGVPAIKQRDIQRKAAQNIDVDPNEYGKSAFLEDNTWSGDIHGPLTAWAVCGAYEDGRYWTLPHIANVAEEGNTDIWTTTISKITRWFSGDKVNYPTARDSNADLSSSELESYYEDACGDYFKKDGEEPDIVRTAWQKLTVATSGNAPHPVSVYLIDKYHDHIRDINNIKGAVSVEDQRDFFATVSGAGSSHAASLIAAFLGIGGTVVVLYTTTGMLIAAALADIVMALFIIILPGTLMMLVLPATRPQGIRLLRMTVASTFLKLLSLVVITLYMLILSFIDLAATEMGGAPAAIIYVLMPVVAYVILKKILQRFNVSGMMSVRGSIAAMAVATKAAASGPLSSYMSNVKSIGGDKSSWMGRNANHQRLGEKVSGDALHFAGSVAKLDVGEAAKTAAPYVQKGAMLASIVASGGVGVAAASASTGALASAGANVGTVSHLMKGVQAASQVTQIASQFGGGEQMEKQVKDSFLVGDGFAAVARPIRDDFAQDGSLLRRGINAFDSSSMVNLLSDSDKALLGHVAARDPLAAAKLTAFLRLLHNDAQVAEDGSLLSTGEVMKMRLSDDQFAELKKLQENPLANADKISQLLAGVSPLESQAKNIYAAWEILSTHGQVSDASGRIGNYLRSHALGVGDYVSHAVNELAAQRSLNLKEHPEVVKVWEKIQAETYEKSPLNQTVTKMAKQLSDNINSLDAQQRARETEAAQLKQVADVAALLAEQMNPYLKEMASNHHSTEKSSTKSKDPQKDLTEVKKNLDKAVSQLSDVLGDDWRAT